MARQFTSAQRYAISEGAKKRDAMIRQIIKIAENATRNGRENYQDALISGTTGIGKTYNAEKALKERGIYPVVLTQEATMFYFGTALMTHHYYFMKHRKSPDEKLVIVLDDCDSFFESKGNINILKGMTGKQGSRVFQYNAVLQHHLLTEEQLNIVEHYKPTNGTHGFHVNCDDVVFIITTNFKLPYESEAKEYLQKNGPTARANRLSDLSAIRGRLICKDFIIPKTTNWGWIVDVCLNDGGLDILPDEDTRYELLEWIWYNWDDMTESNLRTVEKMALEVLEDPDNYKDNWEADFLISR
jgi:hypothetical protein